MEFISKFCSPNTFTTSTITQWITSLQREGQEECSIKRYLNHESFDDTMENEIIIVTIASMGLGKDRKDEEKEDKGRQEDASGFPYTKILDSFRAFVSEQLDMDLPFISLDDSFTSQGTVGSHIQSHSFVFSWLLIQHISTRTSLNELVEKGGKEAREGP
jgi:hypothetical protein